MRQRGKLKHWDFIVLDFLVLMSAYLLANLFRYGAIWSSDASRNQVLIIILGFVVSNLFWQPYKNILKRGSFVELRSTFLHTLQMALIDIVCLYFIHQANATSRLVMFYLWSCYFLLSYLFHCLLKKARREQNKNVAGKSPMMILADAGTVKDVLRDFNEAVYRTYDIAAAFLTDYDPAVSPSEIEGLPVRGGKDEAMEYATRNWVEGVFLGGTNDADFDPEFLDQLCNMGVRVHVLLARKKTDEQTYNVQYPELYGNYVVMTQVQRVIPTYRLFLKRCLDIIGGIVGCLITAILCIIVGPIIYIQSPGPILYRSTRVGKNGKYFTMYKFRSMYPDADQRKQELMARNKMSDGMMFKVENDPRIIGSEKKRKDGSPGGIGNFIRRTSIDEFPQFWSVLKGDMSLVGTRPPTPDEYVRYSAAHKARLSMRPGITGLWQVSGRSHITDFDEVVALDTEYIRTWDNVLDLKILLKTVEVVLKHDGAE